MVWYLILSCSMVWYRIVSLGMMWYGMVWYGSGSRDRDCYGYRRGCGYDYGMV